MRRREFVASLTALSVGGAAVGAASGGALQQGGQLGELQFDSTCSLLNADQQPLTDDALVAVWGEPTATNGDEDGNGDAVSYPSETPIPLVAVDSGVVGVGAPLVADGDDNFGAGNEEFLLNVWDDQLGSGKVLWDESHGQYYDLSRFGQFETYAESNGYDVQATAEYAVEGSSDLVNALDTAAPAGVVITSPSEGFTDAEQSRLATYVENGGTLLVHSQSDFNDFDATANLDDLASTLGVGFRFNDDQVFDTANNGGADYVPVTSNFNTTFPFFEDRDGISTQLDLQKGESYEVTVTSVADGDTVDVEFPSGPVESVRVLGIDTPETASSASAERPEEWEGLGRRAPVFGPLTFGSTSSLLAPDRSTLTDDSVVAVRAAASATNEDADGNGDAVTYPSETPIPLAASDGRVAGLGAMLVDDDSGDRTFGSANEEFVLNVWDQLVGPGSTVTFDDGHGQFYSSDKFGDFTAYAEENGYTVEATTDLTSVLVETDAIVITSPAEAFSDEELTALSTFVDDGGALLCHDQSDYNDFDATDNINAVAEAVGAPFRFNDDQVVDADSNAGQPFLPQTTGFNTTTFAYFGDRSGLGSDDTAPEPNYPTLSSYAAEASTFAADRLADATVTLSFDQNEPIRDPFGRLLAYVEYDAGGETTLYNRAVVDAGLARVYDSTLERHDEFLVAENSARTEGRGLWADSDTSATPPIRNRPVDGLFFPKPTSVVTESGPLASEASVVTTESTARQVEESVTYEGDIPVAGIDTDGRVAVVGAPIVDEGYEVAEGFDVDTSGYENYTFLSNLLETMSERDGAVVVDGGHGQFAEDWALSAEGAAY
jgi:endonuclease YncB( thermonuclease family)